MARATKQTSLPRKPGLKLGAKGRDVESVQRLLLDLGYLTAEAPAEEADVGALVLTKPGVFDTVTELALKIFQEQRGLKPSGNLDQATLDVMTGITCRVFVRSHVPAGALGGAYEKRIFTYKVLNDTARIAPVTLRHAVAQAFSLWSAETPLAFVPTSGDRFDISLRFTPLEGAVLGNALIELDDTAIWRIGPQRLDQIVGSYDVITTAAHEIGHVLGMNHNIPAVARSVMNVSQPHDEFVRALIPLDVANIQALHGRVEPVLASWVHGHSAEVENPESLNRFVPERPHLTVFGKQGFSCWFHLSIPTPYDLKDGGRLRLNAVHLKLTTFSRVEIDQVDIYDGATFLGRHFLNLSNGSGNLPTLDWNLRLGVAHKPLMTSAVGVSVKIRFDARNDQTRRVHINAAGAEFVGGVLEPAGSVFQP